MSATTDNPLARGQIVQIAYVVPRLAAAREYFLETVGIGPWVTPPTPRIEDYTFRGKTFPDGDPDIEVSFAWVGELQIELVEPHTGSSNVFTEFLAERPEGGLHHFDLLVDDYDAAVEAMGGPSAALQSARIGEIRFAIFEAPVVGGFIELLYLDDKAKAGWFEASKARTV